MRLDELLWQDVENSIGPHPQKIAYAHRKNRVCIELRRFAAADSNCDIYVDVIDPQGSIEQTLEEYGCLEPLMAQCVLNELLAKYPLK